MDTSLAWCFFYIAVSSYVIYIISNNCNVIGGNAGDLQLTGVTFLFCFCKDEDMKLMKGNAKVIKF